jgi:hypothetical protein
MNTEQDLRRSVARHLKDALGGKEVDTDEIIPMPRIPHMLGITDLDSIHDPNNEENTLLDPQSQFWNEFDGEVRTRRAVLNRVQETMHSLEDDELFRVTYPYGLESGVISVEVDIPVESNE